MTQNAWDVPTMNPSVPSVRRADFSRLRESTPMSPNIPSGTKSHTPTSILCLLQKVIATLLSPTLHCSLLLYSALVFSTLLYVSASRYSTPLSATLPGSLLLLSTSASLLSSPFRYSALLSSTLLFSSLRYSKLHSTTLHFIFWKSRYYRKLLN